MGSKLKLVFRPLTPTLPYFVHKPLKRWFFKEAYNGSNNFGKTVGFRLSREDPEAGGGKFKTGMVLLIVRGMYYDGLADDLVRQMEDKEAAEATFRILDRWERPAAPPASPLGVVGFMVFDDLKGEVTMVMSYTVRWLVWFGCCRLPLCGGC